MATSKVVVALTSGCDSESKSEVQETSGTTSKTIMYLLDWLKAPKKPNLIWKQKVTINPPMESICARVGT